MSSRELLLALHCCGENLRVIFDSRESPSFPEGSYRKNISCPGCQKVLILSLEEDGSHQVVNQEVLDI